MSRIAYVNGRYLPQREAVVNIEDRGYQFADGVYEVVHLYRDRFIDTDRHMARLERSLREIRLTPPMGCDAMLHVLREVARRNRVSEGILYMQVTRGVSRRDHGFPTKPVPPSMVVTVRRGPPYPTDIEKWAVSAITHPDQRWARCDIKGIGLLANVLAKQAARDRGAAEAWFVDDLGLVTEGASSNAWIIDKTGALRTRDTQANILRGITRKTLLEVIGHEGLTLEERAFTPQEAKEAREAFITGAGTLVLPVVKVDGAVLGDGKPGPVAKRLRQLYIEEARRTAW